MISLKAGVKLSGLRAEMVLPLLVVESFFSKRGKEAVITSALDGTHSSTSLHYSGAALDFRTRELKDGEQQELLRVCKWALGEDFDVVLEPDHLHVEFQPRR